MRIILCSLPTTLFLFAAGAAYCTDPATVQRAVFQYKSGDIAIPAASADEPKVREFGAASFRAAGKYLDDGALAWTRERSCIACHTTGVYMAERPALTALLGPPSQEVLAEFIADLPDESVGQTQKPRGQYYPVGRSLGLAQWDKYVTQRLSSETVRSLKDMLGRLPETGLFKTVSTVEIPYATTDFELTVQAARAAAAAPGWLSSLRDPELLERIRIMKAALTSHQPRNDYEAVLRLQLAGALPDTVPQPDRDAAIALLWRRQHADGGWSTRDMSAIDNWGNKYRDDTLAMLRAEPDVGSPESDAYMTAFAITLLRESGVAADDQRIQRGLVWLKTEQRESGRWWMKSLYRPTLHFSTYIATAQALRALALCGEAPEL